MRYMSLNVYLFPVLIVVFWSLFGITPVLRCRVNLSLLLLLLLLLLLSEKMSISLGNPLLH